MTFAATPSQAVSPSAMRVAVAIVFTIYGLIHARIEWNLCKKSQRREQRGFDVAAIKHQKRKRGRQ